MLTPSRDADRNTGQVDDVFAMHTETRGGSNDTEVKELAAIPFGSPSTIAAMPVTPLGKAEKARLKSSAE
jgi:hypothetical protein